VTSLLRRLMGTEWEHPSGHDAFPAFCTSAGVPPARPSSKYGSRRAAWRSKFLRLRFSARVCNAKVISIRLPGDDQGGAYES
jgi:hypothetical protein